VASWRGIIRRRNESVAGESFNGEMAVKRNGGIIMASQYHQRKSSSENISKLLMKAYNLKLVAVGNKAGENEIFENSENGS
jgi:hypothetical protein